MTFTGAACAVPPEIVSVTGEADPAFEAVVEILVRVVAAQGSGGAALCIFRHGKVMLDVVAGDYADDSLQVLFSVSKALTAVAAARAHEAGRIDLDAPLSSYWPEMDKPSTRIITPRMVLGHRSGLASLDRSFSLAEALAGQDDAAVGTQEPYWEPGKHHGYHSFTFGTLLNGAFRRVLNESVGDYFAREVARPRHLDLWIGAPDSVHARVRKITYQVPRVSPARVKFLSMCAIPAGTGPQLARSSDYYNSPDFYRACWPASSGIGSARSLARFFDATLHDPTLLSSSARAKMLTPLSRGMDLVLGMPTQFASGMERPFPIFPMLGPRSYGHEAVGGTAAFADDEFDVAVGFTTNVYPSTGGAAAAGFQTILATLRYCLTEG